MALGKRASTLRQSVRQRRKLEPAHECADHDEVRGEANRVAMKRMLRGDRTWRYG